MNDINYTTTEYKEEIKLDYQREKIYNETTNSLLYDAFWRHKAFKSLRLWPEITLIKDQNDLNNYFKIELKWYFTPHNQVTINLNNKKAYTFGTSYADYKFISINSEDSKIKWVDIYKIDVGIFYGSRGGIIYVNRTREINLTHSIPTNTHLLMENEMLKFKSINQITILNQDPSDRNTNLKYNTVSFYPNILKTHSLWTTVSKIEIKNDLDVERIYSNQISDISISGLLFGDNNENMDLILSKIDNGYNLNIDGYTNYDYKREGTYKEPNIDGKKGYYIPYNFKGEFYPTVNISINNYFENFQIIYPYSFENSMLDKDDGMTTMVIDDDLQEFNPLIETDSVTVAEDDFNTIINENLSIEGIKNLSQ